MYKGGEVKVSKEFWVSDEFLNDDKTINVLGLSRRKTPHFRHLITISYEINREVTIKESDFERYLQEWDLNTPSIRVTDYLKEKLFGGGENE